MMSAAAQAEAEALSTYAEIVVSVLVFLREY
jgi:hypothetical protein